MCVRLILVIGQLLNMDREFHDLPAVPDDDLEHFRCYYRYLGMRDEFLASMRRNGDIVELYKDHVDALIDWLFKNRPWFLTIVRVPCLDLA